MDPALSRVLADAWDELRRGADDRHHGFHVPTLCTVGCDGAPVARSVVLRRVLVDSSEIVSHTDVRSAKVAEIARDPRVCWHFYAPERKLQLRVSAVAEFHRHGARADEGWSRSSLSSRRCYLAPRAPGAACAGPSPNLPAGILDRRPTDEEAAPGRANFGVVVTRAYAIDWLFLASDGHQRARFEKAGGSAGGPDGASDGASDGGSDGGSWSGCWVEP